MKIHFSPFGVVSNRIFLSVFLSFVAFVILFFSVIVKLLAIVLIGMIGWMIGSVLDDRYVWDRWKFRIREGFSRRT